MKKNKHSFIIIMLYIFIILILFEFYIKKNNNDNTTDVQVTNQKEVESTNADFFNYPGSENNLKDPDVPDDMPTKHFLDVPYISQYPQLPTGCEITSLAEVLSFYGYPVDKEELARKYLPMSDTADENCFIEYFLGSPWKKSGSGCFAPTIVTAANNFLKDQGSTLEAYSLSYSSVNSLFYEVSKGHPIIVWTSFDYNDTEMSYREITLKNGKTFSWPENEHCVVLCGYDLENQTVKIADPSTGIVEHNIDIFTSFYQKYFYQAVVIK